MAETETDVPPVVVEYRPMPKLRESLAAGIDILRAKLNAIKVDDPGAREAAATLALKAREALKVADAGAKEESGALSTALANVRALWSPILDGFKKLRAEMDAKSGEISKLEREREDAQRKEAEEKLAAERKRQEEIEAAKKAGKTVPKAEEQKALVDLRHARQAVDALPAVGAPKSITLESGTLNERLVWDFVVTDFAKVPEEYTKRVLDEDKVQAAIDGGVREIAGLKIEQKSAFTGRSRR